MQGRQGHIGKSAGAGRDHVTGFDGALLAGGSDRFAGWYRLPGRGLLRGCFLLNGFALHRRDLRVLFGCGRRTVNCGDPDLCTRQHTCDQNSDTTLGHGKFSVE
ncbi:hypothetical protein D3C83_08110 [compost metagenome]